MISHKLELFFRIIKEEELRLKKAEEEANTPFEVIGNETETSASAIESSQADSGQSHSTVMSDETQLLRQDFLLYPEITIGDYIGLHGCSVFDFIRYECGEKV